MSLQPVDPILDTILKVAERDPRAAQELVRLSLYESLTEQIEEARPRIDQDGAKWMAGQVLKARATFEQAGVSKSMADVPETAEILEGLEAIEVYIQKDLLGTALSFFNRIHPRDDSGRFVRQGVGSRTDSNAPVGTRQGGHKDEARQYVQAWQQNHLIGQDGPVMLHFTRVDAKGRPLAGKGAGEVRHPASANNLEARIDQIIANEPNLLLNGVSLDRKSIPQDSSQQRAALDAMAMFTGAQGVPTAARFAQALPYDAQGNVVSQDNNAASWNRPTSPGDRQSYRRLQLTGQALESVSSSGSLGATVGGMARLIGDLGPEAEKVFGPGVRRTAYRYRGTERRPDQGIVRAVEEANTAAKLLSGAEGANPEHAAILQRQLERPLKGEEAVAIGVAHHYNKDRFKTWPQDRLELAMQGDAATVGLLESVPNQKLAAVSIEAGELPPSVGVLIDADGDIVSHAQGFNGDHYLPFDLKNLADLHGGQYVRTRAAGGPTTEDVYTGLMMGARQMQVVSNSGVFTVEFDPDIRGGRRYTDKATRMIQRYGHLLAAIEGGSLYENDVDGAKRSQLRTKAYESVGWDPDLGPKRYTELLDKERMQATVNQEDEDNLYEQAIAAVNEADANQRAAGGGYSPQQRARHIEDTVKEFKAEANAKKVRQMVLDGKGYATALLSLKQEFPFYIRDVRYEPIEEFAGRRGARTNPSQNFDPYTRDRGYTERGQTNAKVTLREGAVNAGRKVGMGYVPGRQQAVEGGTEQQRAGAQQRTGAGGTTGSTATQAAPVRDGKVVAPIATGTKTFDQIIGPGSPTEDNLRNALGHTMSIMQGYYDANPDFSPLDQSIDKIPSSASPVEVAFHVAVTKHARKPREVAAWLYNEATDDEREKFIEGLYEVRKLSERWVVNGQKVGDQELARHAGSVEQFDADLDTLDQLVKLKHPWAEPAQNMVMADPAEGRPQPFPFAVQLGNKVANYEKYLEMAETDDHDLAIAIDEATNKPDDIIPNIEKLLHQHKLEQEKEAPDQDKLMIIVKALENRQRAWAFVTAYDIAEVVDEGKAEAPEEGPEKEEAKKSHQRRVFVWHSPSESFSKRVLQGLDLP